MPQQQLDSQVKMKGSTRCCCCPYGFHIDRDFVRYCDSLYNTAQLEKLKQHKRERRKEKKSVESYLGLTNQIYTDKLSEKNLLDQPKVLSNLFLNCDSLQDAVSDFEDTWQKSLKKSSSCHTIIDNNNKSTFETVPISNSYAKIIPSSMHANTSSEEYSSAVSEFPTPNSSTSSIKFTSTQSTTESNKNNSSSMSPHVAATVASFVHSGTSQDYNVIGIHKSVLTCIRDQMATSLSRMKELEDQVKSIPVLQVKLSTLKEENKVLMLQLQSKDAISNDVSLNSHSQEPEIQVKTQHELPSSATSTCDVAIIKENHVEIEPVCRLSVDSYSSNSRVVKESNSKSIGISCSVLTRDIGIGYVPHTYKSIGVGNDLISNREVCIHCQKKQHMEQSTSISSESLESDIDSFEDGVSALPKLNQEYLKSKSSGGFENSLSISVPAKKMVNVAVGTARSFNHKSVSTDLKHTEIISKCDLDYKKGLLRNKGTSCWLPIQISKGIQTYDHISLRHFGTQTLKFKTDEINLSTRATSTTNEILSTKVKSVAVGDSNVNYVLCDKCKTITTVSRASGDFSVSGSYCDKCVLRQTETIGVGDNDINKVCETCEADKSDIKKKQVTKSTGTNTVMELSNTNTSDSTIRICDKCCATIQSVAQDLASNNAESKIPRLNLASTSIFKTSKHTKLSEFDSFSAKQNKYGLEKLTIKSIGDNIKEKEGQRIVSKSKTGSEHESLQYPASKNVNEKQLTSDNVIEPKVGKLEELDLKLTSDSHKNFELSVEVKAACKVLNDYLQKPGRGSEKKILSSSRIVQNEWFRVANHKLTDPFLIERYLDVFEEFSKQLLHRIVNLSDSNGNTALHYAVSYGNFDVVSILIDSKVCDVNKQNKAGYTSIMLVALADMQNDTHHYVVQRLFSIGDINIKATQNGQTALMLAVSHGKKDIVITLLDVGAEINLQDKDGSTALMCAAEHGHLDIVKLLLAHPECDPYIVDGDDCNALTIAMEAGHKDIGLLIYANMNFSRGSSPYSTLKSRKRSTPRSTPPPRTPTLRTPPPPSPSARSTNSIPSSFHFH